MDDLIFSDFLFLTVLRLVVAHFMNFQSYVTCVLNICTLYHTLKMPRKLHHHIRGNTIEQLLSALWLHHNHRITSYCFNTLQSLQSWLLTVIIPLFLRTLPNSHITQSISMLCTSCTFTIMISIDGQINVDTASYILQISKTIQFRM